MAPTYYVIELSARWLTVLLVALALVMVLAFSFGYGAAWSVISARGSASGEEGAPAIPVATVSPTPLVSEEVILDERAPTQRPTARPQPPTPQPTPTTAPAPTSTAGSAAEPADEDGFWVQVIASSLTQTVERARTKMSELGFPDDHQRVTTTQVAGGGVMYKLRVGPFPNRDSADRVARRMRASGYPDAWVVAPRQNGVVP
jgi:cell division septation protein DedD